MQVGEPRFFRPFQKNGRPAYIVAETGCWLWNGCLNSRGYPLRGSGKSGRSELVHRSVVKHYHGPIPEGWHAHHECRTRACVNPDHLRAVSPVDHARLDQGVSASQLIESCLEHYGPTFGTELLAFVQGAQKTKAAARSALTRMRTTGQIVADSEARYRLAERDAA